MGDRKACFGITARRDGVRVSTLPGVAKDHRVFWVLGAAAPHDQQVGVRLSFPQRLPQLGDYLADTLAGLSQLGLGNAHARVRFHAIDGPLDLAQRAGPADRRSEQPEQPAQLRVVSQVDSPPHAPGDAVIVRVAANAGVVFRRRIAAPGLLLLLLRQQSLGLRQAQPHFLAVGPGDGPLVNLAQRQRPRFLLDDSSQVLPILPLAARRLEPSGREVGSRRLKRFLNLVGQLREGAFLFGTQIFKLRRTVLLQQDEGIAQHRQGFAERCSRRPDALGIHAQLDQGLSGFGIVGAGLQVRLARPDLSFLAVAAGHGHDPQPARRVPEPGHFTLLPGSPKRRLLRAC